jgi:hypothetical protein
MSGNATITVIISDEEGLNHSISYSLIAAEKCKINYHNAIVESLINSFNKEKLNETKRN